MRLDEDDDDDDDDVFVVFARAGAKTNPIKLAQSKQEKISSHELRARFLKICQKAKRNWPYLKATNN